MRRAAFRAGLVFSIACGAYAQSPGDSPSFEVASVKPAEGQNMGFIRIQMNNTPGRVHYTGISLRLLIINAYGIKNYQLTGPAWLDTQRFDITATYKPADAPNAQVRLMLQNLLAERFKMQVRRENKELPAYALVVAKGGPKLKESEDQTDPPEGQGRGGGIPDFGALPVGGGGGGAVMMQRDGGPGGAPPPPPPQVKEGFGATGDKPFLPPEAGRGFVGRGGMMVRPGHMEAGKAKLATLVNFLSGQMARPVVDETGLTKYYDITLDWAPDAMGGGGRGMMANPPDSGGSTGGAPVASAPDSSSGPALPAALQQQLGLKLDPRKLPVEMITVEHMEKAPVEN